MKIPSASNNFIRSKLCTNLVFTEYNKVTKRRKDVEVLNSFPFFEVHTKNIESEAVERSGRGGGEKWLLLFL